MTETKSQTALDSAQSQSRTSKRLGFFAIAAITWAGCFAGLGAWWAVLSDFLPYPLHGPHPLLIALASLIPAVWLAKVGIRLLPAPSPGLTAPLVLGVVIVLPLPALFVGGGLGEDLPGPCLALNFLAEDWLSGVRVASGVVFASTGSEVPVGWLVADGRALPREGHELLYDEIGTFYGGSADTFHLPDFRGMYLPGSLASGGEYSNVFEVHSNVLLRPVSEVDRQLIENVEGTEIQWLIKE